MDIRAHEHYMRRCLELAAEARARGDHPVGAVVVRAGHIVGEGAEAVRAQCDVTAHAEIVALRNACASLQRRDLSGSILYTTVEPCVMCAYAIRLARIEAVVTGTRPDGATDYGASVLSEAGMLASRPTATLLRGVLEDECQALLRDSARERPPL